MKKIILLSLITAPFIMVGCGGGGSSTTTSAKISGTVPGTLIEAFCDNNYYAKVTSIQNGTNEHPFEIEVPTGTNCRLIMTTNENDPANRVITPIAFSNGTTIVLNNDINLGFIPLKLSYQDADDRDGDHVVDTPLILDINNTTTNNLAVQDNNGNGLVDAYDDDDNDNIPNAYEDDDNDGIVNIHDDDDNDGRPDHVDDEDGDNNRDDSQTTMTSGNNNDIDDDHENDIDDDDHENDIDDDNDRRPDHVDDDDGDHENEMDNE